MQGAVPVGTPRGLNSKPFCAHDRANPPSLFALHAQSLPKMKDALRQFAGGNGLLKSKQSPNLNPKRRFLLSVAQAQAEGSNPVAPLKPESPTGEFLVQLLQSHPHLVPSAAEQQLERLAEDREMAGSQEQPNTLGSDPTLYKRIAELKSQERQIVLEDIIYTLVVQRFVEVGVPMVFKVPSTSDGKRPDFLLPVQDKELEYVHSPEALDLIREHVALILGSGRGVAATDTSDENIVVQIGRFKVGQAYAATVLFGYFLRRVDERFQLEKKIKMLSSSTNEIEAGKSFEFEFASAVEAMADSDDSFGFAQTGVKPSKLRSYVMSFDSQTLYRNASIRSEGSFNVIEKHAQALFGKPEVQTLPDGTIAVLENESLRLHFSELKRLVLEAAAFGSFLWDVESFVDSHYTILHS